MKKNIRLIALFLASQFSANAQLSWQNISTKGMGYVDGLFIHPLTNVKYVRTDVGGVFRFNDADQNWYNLLDKMITQNENPITNVETFAFDKNTSGTSQIIYALCGDGIKSYMMKSVNDGSSWTINQGWYPDSIKVYGNGDWRCAGERLAIDPNNSDVVYCGTRYNGLWKTVNAAQQWNKVISFTAVGGNGGLTVNGGLSFVVFDPSSTITVSGKVVSKNIYVGLIDGGIYRSNNGGSSWCFLANGFNISTYNPVRAVFNNNRLIVALMQDGDKYNDGELWQFTPNAGDCDGTWANKTPGLQNNYQCPVYGKYMFNAVTVKPGTSNTVYAAIRGTTPRKIFYTENFDAAFPNWKILTMDDNSGYSGACLSQYQPSVFTAPPSWVNTAGYDWVGDIAFDAADNKKLWLTSGNGVMKVEDVTASPAIISGVNTMQGLEILCVNDMASPPLPNTTPLISAAMDVMGIVYTNITAGNVQKLDNTLGLGAGISLAYSFKNPNTMALLGQDYFDPVNINRKLRSTDGGLSWQSFWPQAPGCSDAPWGGNIAISATNANNMVWVPNFESSVAGCTQPVKNYPRYTTNGGTTWTTCGNINFNEGSFPFSLKSTFAIGKSLESDKVNGNKFYYYAMPGQTFLTQLWRTINGGATWQKMSEAAMPITGGGQLKANPFKEDDIWFAPYNGYIKNNDPNPDLRKLWHSADGGTNWTKLTAMDEVYAFGFGMKQNAAVNASLIVYGKKNNVESIFTSDNLGNTFTDIGTLNLPKGIVGNIEGDMKVQGRIYAATGCRGIWMLNQNIVLPVNLLNFSGYRTNNINYLKWKVESTNDLLGFVVEYSSNGIDFTKLDDVNAGSTTSYEYQHLSNSAITYYRIKLIHKNGTVKFSNIIKLQNQNGIKSSLYPNPSSGAVTLSTPDLKLLGTLARVVSANGSLMEKIKVTGNYTLFNVSRYSAGTYHLKLANGEVLQLIKR